MCSFLLLFYSNFVRKTHRFWDIQLQKCRDLENRVRGPWSSLKMSPFDTELMTAYWSSIVTMALSCVISDIFNVEKHRDLVLKLEWMNERLSSFCVILRKNWPKQSENITRLAEILMRSKLTYLLTYLLT